MPPATQESIVKNLAHIALETVKIEVPQKIGSLEVTNQGQVKPIPAITADAIHPVIFNDLKSYILFLFSVKRSVISPPPLEKSTRFS